MRGHLAKPNGLRDLQHSFCSYKTNVAWVFGYTKNRTLSPQLNAWPFGKAKWPKRLASPVSGLQITAGRGSIKAGKAHGANIVQKFFVRRNICNR